MLCLVHFRGEFLYGWSSALPKKSSQYKAIQFFKLLDFEKLLTLYILTINPMCPIYIILQSTKNCILFAS